MSTAYLVHPVILVTLYLLQVPDPFPIPAFRETTEENLNQRQISDNDRKYMVRVLGTLLCTYIQRPTMKHCRTVAQSLVRKYAFLKEAVSYSHFYSCSKTLY